MRRLLILLLMSLLPLHGFAAAVMGIEMTVSGKQIAIETVATDSMNPVTKVDLSTKNAPAEHASMPCHASAGVEAPIDPSSCFACSACHTLALGFAVTPSTAEPSPQRRPTHAASANTPADLTTETKPPKPLT